jgi:ubiquinone/menaquinone biosynthesis C-methylase UbiE
MTIQQDALAELRRSSYELWERMAPIWERGRELTWRCTRPVSEWLVQSLDPRPGQTILDLAAGTGETGFLVAERLGPEGRLISSDFSPAMVRTAERVARELGIANVDFRVLDAERIELEDGSVDGVVCRFSYMLMPDPAQALRETRRVLRDGGRLALSTWGDPARNPWMTASAGVMIKLGVMEAFSSSGPGMFTLPDAETLEPLLTEAGFREIEAEEMEVPWRFESSDEFWTFVSELQGPVAVAISKLDERGRRRARAAIEERASEFATNGGYQFPGLSLNAVAR